METATPEHNERSHTAHHEHGLGSVLSESAEDSQYHEVSTTQSVPAKTGDEEPLSSGFDDSDRPVSAGTSHSGQFELENPEEAAFLASVTTHTRTQPRIANESVDVAPTGGQLLARPPSSDGISADAAFSFTRASRQQMDFTGTRKGPVTNLTAEAGQDQEEGNYNADRDYTMSDGKNPLLI